MGQGRVTNGLQALYGFQEETGPTVQYISEVGSPLDLNIADRGTVSWIPGVGLTISSPTLISSGGPAGKIFNPMTTIRYELPRTARISLRIFDISGRLVAVLKNNETETAGRHEAVWRGQDQAGRQVAAGIYFYRMEAPSFNETRRMVLVK